MRRSGAALALVLSGCLEPSSLVCADGTVCAADLVCAPVAGCATHDQVRACDGVEEGDDCTVGDVPGVCQGGVCQPLVCGDGRVSGNEQCDPTAEMQATTCRDRGFYQGGDIGCAGDCTWDTASCSEFCGDGLLQADQELCEKGIAPSGTCVSFGFDAGRLGCAGCGADFAACHVIGWYNATIDTAVGLSVNDIADAGDSIIAVGWSVDDGSAFAARWSGTWSLLGTLDADVQPSSVWAVDSDQVWMTGQRGGTAGFVGTWDGAVWSVEDLPDPGVEVWGGADQRVFLLTGKGVRVWDGSQWSFTQLSDSFTGTALSGDRASGTVYAAGRAGEFFRYDGSWAPMEDPPGGDVADIETDQDGSPIVATQYGGIYRWDGEGWLDLKLPVLPEDAVLRVDDEGQLFVFVRSMSEFESTQWTVFHRRDGSWRVISDSIQTSLRDQLSRGFGGFGRQLFVFADYRGFRYGGADWWDLSPVRGAADVWSNGSEVFLVTVGRSVRRLDATGWHGTGLAGDFVDGAGDDVYVLDATSSLLHHRGADGVWSSVVLDVTDPIGIAVRGRDDVFVLGRFGSEIDHWDGTFVSPVVVDAGFLRAIDCSDGGLCVAAGEQGSFWATDKIDSPVDGGLFSVWVAPDDTLFVGGDYGGIWKYDGEWRQMHAPSSNAIIAVGGRSVDDVFASAGGSNLLHHDGSVDLEWLPVRVDREDAQIGELVFAGDGLLVAGETPALLRLERTYPW